MTCSWLFVFHPRHSGISFERAHLLLHHHLPWFHFLLSLHLFLVYPNSSDSWRSLDTKQQKVPLSFPENSILYLLLFSPYGFPLWWKKESPYERLSDVTIQGQVGIPSCWTGLQSSINAKNQINLTFSSSCTLKSSFFRFFS